MAPHLGTAHSVCAGRSAVAVCGGQFLAPGMSVSTPGFAFVTLPGGVGLSVHRRNFPLSLGLIPAGLSSACPAGPLRFMADRKAQQKSRRKSSVVVEASVAPSPEEAAIEEATGIQFLKQVSTPGSSKQLTFVGAGVREKAIAFIKVKVYAVGFYVDRDVSAHLGAWKGKPGVEVAEDENFYRAFVDAPVTKAIAITLARDVDGAQFWGALDEALAPRLKVAAGGREGEEALANFAKVFQGRPFKSGTTVLLNWIQPGTLEVSISNSTIPASDVSIIESQLLAAALFDIYLGPVAIAPSAKIAMAIQAEVVHLI